MKRLVTRTEWSAEQKLLLIDAAQTEFKELKFPKHLGRTADGFCSRACERDQTGAACLVTVCAPAHRCMIAPKYILNTGFIYHQV